MLPHHPRNPRRARVIAQTAVGLAAAMTALLVLAGTAHGIGQADEAYLEPDTTTTGYTEGQTGGYTDKCPKPVCTPAYFTPPDPTLGPKPEIRGGGGGMGYLSRATPERNRRWRDDMQMVTTMHFGSRRLELADEFNGVQQVSVQVTSLSFGLRYHRKWWTVGAAYGLGFGTNLTGLLGNGGNWVAWFARVRGGLNLELPGENRLGLSAFATAHLGVSDFSICAYGTTNFDLCADETRFAWGPDIGIAIRPWERVGFVLGYLGDYSNAWVEHSGYLGVTMQSSPRAIIAFAAVPLYILLFGALN